MLLSTNKITGFTLNATDGHIGKVTAILFDDRDWSVRYISAQVPRWLGREVLLAPESFDDPDWARGTIPVSLSKKRIKDSPDISLDTPVSRQQLQSLHAYYGWSTSWGTPDRMLTAPVPVLLAESDDDADGDPNLRSSAATVGLSIAATDGEIGHVEDFIVDTEAWKIRYLIVDTKNWLPGKKVYILPGHVTDIDWAGSRVSINLTKEQIEQSTEFDPALPINREVETRLLDFYGRPHYWG